VAWLDRHKPRGESQEYQLLALPGTRLLGTRLLGTRLLGTRLLETP